VTPVSFQNFPPHGVARVLVQLDDPAGQDPFSIVGPLDSEHPAVLPNDRASGADRMTRKIVRIVPAVIVDHSGPRFQGFPQIATDRLEYRAAHELVGLGEVYPAHFGQLLLVADNSLGSVSRPGCQIDHLAPRVGMDAAPYDTRNAYPQPCFLADFAYCRVGWLFSMLDFTGDECPRRLAIVAPSDQDTEAASNDSGNDRESRHGPDYSSGVLNFSIASAPVSADTRSNVQGPELTSPSLPNPAHWPFIR
jgi:hypothetical protein